MDSTGSGQRHAREPLAQRGDGLAVVSVIVRERDPSQPAPALELSRQGADVVRQGRPRVH